MLLTPELITALERFRIESRRRFLGAKAGSHRSMKRGHGIEFSDYRQYEPGDNPRQIDWRVYARSERLYIKQYQEEEDIRVFLLLDSSASMSDPPKWRLAKTVALSLSYLASIQQDSVCLATTGSTPTAFLRGASALRHFDTQLETLSPRGHGTLTDAVASQLRYLKFPGIVCVISDFMYEQGDIESALRIVRGRNMDGACVSILSKNDLQPLAGEEAALLEDSETGERESVVFDSETKLEYTKRLTRHLTGVRDIARRNDFGFALIREGNDLIQSLFSQRHGLRIVT